MKITLGKGLPLDHPALRGWFISAPVTPRPATAVGQIKRRRRPWPVRRKEA